MILLREFFEVTAKLWQSLDDTKVMMQAREYDDLKYAGYGD